MLLSPEQLASSVPSGENLMLETGRVCPRNTVDAENDFMAIVQAIAGCSSGLREIQPFFLAGTHGPDPPLLRIRLMAHFSWLSFVAIFGAALCIVLQQAGSLSFTLHRFIVF
jgi:hypothetical protein